MLAQYFQRDVSRCEYFEVGTILKPALVKRINQIIRYHSDFSWNDDGEPGLVVASAFAFIEIARKFDAIVMQRFSVTQFAAFIDAPPNWFKISPVDKDLLPALHGLPANVIIENGSQRPLELADAIHVATAISREKFLLVATDERIISLTPLKSHILDVR
mgnify:CR=1 FL=1